MGRRAFPRRRWFRCCDGGRQRRPLRVRVLFLPPRGVLAFAVVATRMPGTTVSAQRSIRTRRPRVRDHAGDRNQGPTLLADRALNRFSFPLVNEKKADAYDDWALKWLHRWITETGGTIDQARAIAARRAAIPFELEAIHAIHEALR
jgi:hypothetical protein